MANPTTWWTAVTDTSVPTLDRTPRPGVKSAAAVRSVLQPLLAGLEPERRDACLSLALLWHDHHEDAHGLCQSHEGNQDCDYVHMLVHRREGDVGNAKYWVRAVGQHVIFAEVGRAAVGRGLVQLVRGERYQPNAMVDACDLAVRSTSDQAALLAQQADEFAILARHLLDT